MPWLVNEAEALKVKFSDITISDVASFERPVDVWFRNPENEIRDMTFPSIVLEISGLNKADDREHRGTTTLGYIPDGFPAGPYPSVDPLTGDPVEFDPGAVPGEDFDPNWSPFKVQDYPIPYNMDFKVTVYSRFQTELIPIVAELAQIDRIPSRFGYVVVPEDGTTRTMDLMAGPEMISERDGEGRRIFEAVYSVRVVTELNLYDVQQIVGRISTVDLDLQYGVPIIT